MLCYFLMLFFATGLCDLLSAAVGPYTVYSIATAALSIRHIMRMPTAMVEHRNAYDENVQHIDVDQEREKYKHEQELVESIVYKTTGIPQDVMIHVLMGYLEEDGAETRASSLFRYRNKIVRRNRNMLAVRVAEWFINLAWACFQSEARVRSVHNSTILSSALTMLHAEDDAIESGLTQADDLDDYALLRAKKDLYTKMRTGLHGALLHPIDTLISSLTLPVMYAAIVSSYSNRIDALYVRQARIYLLGAGIVCASNLMADARIGHRWPNERLYFRLESDCVDIVAGSLMVFLFGMAANVCKSPKDVQACRACIKLCERGISALWLGSHVVHAGSALL